MERIKRKFAGRISGIVIVIACCALLLLSASFVSSFENVERIGNQGTITGIVTDAETDEPLSGVLMTLTYHNLIRTEFTDDKGHYIFKEVPICFCLKNLSASKRGYESQYKMVAVHKITYVDFSLQPIDDEPDSMYGVLCGVVTDAETDNPLPDTFMTLKYHDEVRTQYTDAEGWYVFEDVPLCFCLKNISAHKRGYQSQYHMVAVSELTYANFSLNSESDDASDNSANVPKQELSDREQSATLDIHPLEMLSFAGCLVALCVGLYVKYTKKKH